MNQRNLGSYLSKMGQKQGDMKKPVYKRILLKMSGEALEGKKGFGIDNQALFSAAKQIKEVSELGVGIGVVIGAGNLFRGIEVVEEGVDKITADYIGMLSTIINSLALQSALEKIGLTTRVLTTLEMRQVAEPYIRRRAIRHLEKGRVVIFAGGTGSPYFTTDTAAVLRAIEIGAEVILKGTKVDGIYSFDPHKNKKARMYKVISYLDILKRDFKVMDATAVSLCKENNLPIIVFNLFKDGNIKRIVFGEKIGTIVK